LSADVYDGCCKGLRRFLRQIVTNTTADDPMRILAKEFLGIGTGVRVWRAIGIPFKSDGGNGDAGSLRSNVASVKSHLGEALAQMSFANSRRYFS
jgi:hypothetical protein